MDNFFEFHCHTSYSSDGGAKIEDIIEVCRKKGISGIAIIDHNRIDGVLALKKIAPDWLTVIVGEEIKTVRGEIIGIFLNEKISPGLSIKETVLEIKKQGGLVILPHPFDRLRSKKIPLEEIKKNIDQFDIIETFNARNIFKSDNKKAQDFAKIKNKIPICGSDAHFIGEYGKTLIRNLDYSNPREFLKSLQKTTFIEHKAPLFYHLVTKLKKINGNKH